jgi:hypothetical protein
LPIGTPCTALPTACTMPIGSCPTVSGKLTPRSARLSLAPPPRSKWPSRMYTSEWHAPQWLSLNSTSFAPGVGVSRSRRCSGRPHSAMSWLSVLGLSVCVDSGNAVD